MKLQNLKSKITFLGAASKQNAEQMLAEIHVKRTSFDTKVDNAIECLKQSSSKDEVADAYALLQEASQIAKGLGQNAYDLFPRRRLQQISNSVEKLTPRQRQEVSELVGTFRTIQDKFKTGCLGFEERQYYAMQLRVIDGRLAKIVSGKTVAFLTSINNRLVLSIANGLHYAIQPIGLVAEVVSKPLKSSRHWYTGGSVARFFGHMIDGFLSREALTQTGLETSWGVRLIVPGTAGFFGNAGPWAMFYTGQIRDYQAMSVPFRVNPGVTVATDIATFTWNRPGFGAGTATPFASGYVDSARSKLLVGRDGILYVRIGEWEGRGPYFTVSAFIPLLPWMHITWNFSIFSPGWAPLVKWSHPVVIWVRAQADWLWRTATKPFKLLVHK